MRSSRVRSLPMTEVHRRLRDRGHHLVRRRERHGRDADARAASSPSWRPSLFLLYEPFKKLVRTNYTIQQGIAGAERVFELLDTAPDVADRPGAQRC